MDFSQLRLAPCSLKPAVALNKFTVCSLLISKWVSCLLCCVYIINTGRRWCFSLSNVLYFQMWLWIHPVCSGLLPRCPLTSTRPGWKNYEPQHCPDVEGSTSQSAAELFINCRRVEVFTVAHVSVTHAVTVVRQPPSFAPIRAPRQPHERFPWGQKKWVGFFKCLESHQATSPWWNREL